MPRTLLFCCVVLWPTCAPAKAATISVGDHVLLANLPGQPVPIFVTGGEPVSGLNLFAQVGDGGPELIDFGLPAGTDGPEITNVDLKTGTIFEAIPDPQTMALGSPQVANFFIAISAPGGSVPADGLLATLTIDTTGFSSGTWDLLFSGVLPDLGGFDSDFAGVAADDIFNGTITVVPEPAAIALASLGMIAFLLFTRQWLKAFRTKRQVPVGAGLAR